MRFKEIITELFDPKLAKDLEWAEGSDYVAARGYVTVTNPNGYGGEYGNEEEVELEIEFGEYPHPQRKEYEVQFKVDESFAITGGGNTSVIFATVIQACKDFVEMYKPDRLFFTADEQSRARMYDTITKRVAKQVGWHVLPFDEIQKDPLYRHKSGNGFMFVIAKGEAPEKWSSSQKPQHGSFMPIWFVYNLDKDTPTVAVKVRAPDRVAAVAHARKIEPSFKDLDSMQIHALSSLPKREVTDVIDGGTAGVNESVSKKKTLRESKSAPLYHFTSWNNLIRILHSNQLQSPGGKIYLTRDYTRQFIPHEGQLFKQPYGIRLDQELLSRDYGRKLQAGGQDSGWNEKKRQAWLSDPKNAREIEKVKQTGRGSGVRYDGAEPEDIIKGTVTQSRRWESEEHLNVKNLPNLDKYVTGIVVADAPVGSQHFSQEIDPDPMTKLADVLINLFSGAKGFDQRNIFLDYANKLNVPIVYGRRDFGPEQVKKRIIQLYSQRKKEREQERGKTQNSFLVITSPAGGGVSVGGSDINAALKKLSIDPRYRDRPIYGYSMGYEPNAEKKMFDKPIPLLQLVKQGLAEDVGQPTFHVSSHDDFKTAFEVEMVIDNNNPGFFSYQYFPETDDVENDVYIHSDQYRGQGFGKLLLLKAIETAQQHGLPFKPDRNGISPEQRRVYQSLLNDRLINIAPDRTITLRGKQGLAEGSLNEYRDRMYQYLKSIVPRFPDYVVKDWLYANFARGATQGPGWSFATIGKDILRILADMGLSVNTKWQLVPDMKFTMNMWEPKTLKRLQARAGGSSKSADPDVHIPARDAERHATQAQLAQQQGGVRKEPVILIKTAKGYELLEGWHRTIQHFAKYPDGYIGPAYVAVAQGQQGVAEGIGHNVDDLSDVADWMRTTPDKLKMVVKQEPIEKFIKQIREMYGTYDEFPEDEERTNRILKLLKKGSKPLPIYVEDGDPDLFVMEGRHRMVAFWLAGMKTIPVAYVSVKKQGVAENFADGKNPQDKGDSRRHGVPTKASVSTLRKVAKQGGRKGQLAHWMANMKAGKAKKK